MQDIAKQTVNKLRNTVLESCSTGTQRNDCQGYHPPQECGLGRHPSDACAPHHRVYQQPAGTAATGKRWHRAPGRGTATDYAALQARGGTERDGHAAAQSRQ